MSFVQNIRHNLSGDRNIWAIFVFLCVASMLAVYSSAGIMEYRAGGLGVGYSILKHILLILVSGFVAYVVHQLPYKFFSAVAPTFYLLAIVLLIFTMLFGLEINQARRWISLPIIGFSLQTSDLAKVAIILFLARNISSKQAHIKDLKTAFLPLIIPIVVVCGLIAPADLSSAGILFVTCLIMLFVGRIKMQYILFIILMGLVLLSGLFLFDELFGGVTRVDTWMSRLTDFTSGTETTDNIQAKIAIAQGGWFGLGPGNSIQRNFIAYPYADFIYAIICEEYGAIGAFLILIVYLALLFRCTKILTRSRKTFGAVLAFGLCINIVLQALANLAVSVHLVPPTGLNLPMISMGGSSQLFTALQFGIILSVSREVEKNGLHHKTVKDESDD